MNKQYVFVNDIFFEAGGAALFVNDLAIQRGYGVFDFFKTIDGRPVFLDDHLERFYHSAEAMRLPVYKTRAQFKTVLFELMRKNGLPNSGIKITLTGGYSTD